METKEAGINQKKQLAYDQLEAYANQTVAQAKIIFKENEALVEENRNLRRQINYSDISLAFKVLEYHQFFSEECVKRVAAKLEEALTPHDPPQEEPQPENKE